MRSISRRIALPLITGLALLWIAGGSAVLFTSRTAALTRIDAENLELTRQVRSFIRTGGGPGRRHADASTDTTRLVADGLFYQAWTPEEKVLLTSDGLGDSSLPFAEAGGDPVYGTMELGDGVTVRYVTTSFGAGHAGGAGNSGGGPPPWAGGGMRDPVVVAVARDLAPMRSEQLKLLVALAAIGLVAGAATCGVVGFALRSGLRPLRELDEAIAGVSASSLGARFHREGLPAELAPVVSRLDELMERLEDSFQRERHFSSALAHEMRTPLAELRALTELAIDWPEERTEEQMCSIRDVSQRMHRMVDALLDLARLEGEERESRRENVDLGPVLKTLEADLAETASQRGLTVTLDWPPQESRTGRLDWWLTLLENLLTNAVEYAREGGRIDLRPIPSGLELRNSVSDLTDEDLDHFFDRFWRADRSRTGDRHAGLGLSLARACAEAMGYHLQARIDRSDPSDPTLVFKVVSAS